MGRNTVVATLAWSWSSSPLRMWSLFRIKPDEPDALIFVAEHPYVMGTVARAAAESSGPVRANLYCAYLLPVFHRPGRCHFGVSFPVAFERPPLCFVQRIEVPGDAPGVGAANQHLRKYVLPIIPGAMVTAAGLGELIALTGEHPANAILTDLL